MAAKEGEPAKAKDEKSSKRQQLDYLLSQSGIFSKIIGEKMNREKDARMKAADKAAKKEEKAAAKPPASPSTRSKKSQPSTTKKQKQDLDEVIDQEDLEIVAAQGKAKSDADRTTDSRQQSKLVTGATLRDYQSEGVQWMLSLFSNGISGILADEMGLGKTLQTIAFLAYLREQGVWGPFLIVCPLSTVANWVNEFERFTPDIPVLLYHGSVQERAELRSTHLGLTDTTSRATKKARKTAKTPSKGVKDPEKTFPVIVTSYEMVMNDRKYLNSIQFKYIVVDESHRIKNLNCKLIRELKTYQSANRLLLTGTPLQNNLAELWSLLNFILPDIFDDLDSFQQWFDFGDLDSQSGHDRIISEEQSDQIVSKLHAILKPFLLRRLKKDVEKDLPPKKEYLLYAPLTSQQKDLYDAVVSRTLRSFLIDRKTGKSSGKAQENRKRSESPMTPLSELSESQATSPVPSSLTEDTGANTPVKSPKRGAKRKRVQYEEKSDEQFFDDLENSAEESAEEEGAMLERANAFQQKSATKSVNNMKLQNLVMQLRKVCNHPWLFDWPIDPQTGSQAINEDLINASGKMLLLDRLLVELFTRGHKVLLFSQFTSMLDVIEDWAEEYKGWPVCRIDGSTKQADRRQQMKDFNEKKGLDAPNLFLLSTRAGGVGINLVAADTVIIFDSDFNPQQDLQAIDRAHRIGQTKPVLVFRFVTANTIENQILARAGAKRKLEQLVIGEGNFRANNYEMSDILTGKRSKQSMSDLATLLLKSDGEAVTLAGKGDEIISKSQLDKLLDRSDDVMHNRTAGWEAKEENGISGGFEVFDSDIAGGAGGKDLLQRAIEADDE